VSIFGARGVRAAAEQVRDTGRSYSGWAVQALQWILFVSSALVTLLTVRMLVDGREWLQRGMDQLEDGAAIGEVESAFENAARSFVPGSPYPPRALWHLSIMARSAAMRGDSYESVHIWEVVRRSVLATRHVTQPNEDYLKLAETQIVRLRANTVDKDAMASSPDGTIQRPDDPSVVFTLFLFAGLVLWVAASFGVCLSARNRESNTRPFLAILAVFGAGLWITMSWLA